LIPVPPQPVYPGRTVYLCGVRFDGFGAGKIETLVPKDPAFSGSGFGTGVQTSFDNFNAISFGDFNVQHGDIEGRLAVRNNFQCPEGYDIGRKINNAGTSADDIHIPFSFVVGGDATMASGSILPDGSHNPYYSDQEDAYIGGTFSAPAYLQSRRTGGPGNLNSDFDAAKAYYVELSNEIAAVTPNAQFTVQYDGLTITCASVAITAYWITIPDTVFNTIRYYNTPVGCNLNAQFVITVSGDGPVTLGDDSQRFAIKENFLWNIPGTNRLVTALHQPEGSILAPGNILDQNMGTIEGIVIFGTVRASNQINKLMCPPPPPPPKPQPHVHLCPYFETDCSGLLLPLKDSVYSFRDFSVVTFGDFTCFNGDVEGRLAVGGKLNVSSFGIGHELRTFNGPDNSLPYDLVVAGDAFYGVGSGGVCPDGSGIPFPGTKEDIFVGGVLSAPADILARRTGSGSISQYFQAARTCYRQYQKDFQSTPANAQATVQFTNGLLLSCNNKLDSFYTVNVDANTWSTTTWFAVNNCNFQANWVINILGNGPVTFTGGSFPAVGGGVVFNVVGSGRRITVMGTAVDGNILAPDNDLDQTASVIVGKVVVNNYIEANQVNVYRCTDPKPVVITSTTEEESDGPTSVVKVDCGDCFIVGDKITVGGQSSTVTDVNNGDLTLQQPVGPFGVGAKVTTTVSDSTVSRYDPPAATPAAQSGASLFQITFGLIAILVAFTL